MHRFHFVGHNEINPDGVAPEALRDEEGSAAPHEWVKHGAWLRRSKALAPFPADMSFWRECELAEVAPELLLGLSGQGSNMLGVLPSPILEKLPLTGVRDPHSTDRCEVFLGQPMLFRQFHRAYSL